MSTCDIDDIKTLLDENGEEYFLLTAEDHRDIKGWNAPFTYQRGTGLCSQRSRHIHMTDPFIQQLHGRGYKK